MMKKIQILCDRNTCLFFDTNRKVCTKNIISTNAQGECSSFEEKIK